MKTVQERLEADRAGGAGLVDACEAALLAGAKALPSPQARLAFASDSLRLRTARLSIDALRLPHAATPDLRVAETIAEAAYQDGQGAFWERGGLAMGWTADATALMVTHEGEPVGRFDGEHCYHRDLQEPGR